MTETIDRVMIDAGMVMDDLENLSAELRAKANACRWWQRRRRANAIAAACAFDVYAETLLDQMAAQFGLGEWKGRK
jgi:uncharacterized membrane protein